MIDQVGDLSPPKPLSSQTLHQAAGGKSLSVAYLEIISRLMCNNKMTIIFYYTFLNDKFYDEYYNAKSNANNPESQHSRDVF